MRLDEPACQERTGDKKHERHGALSDDERVAQSESALGRIVDPNALTFERGDQVRPRSAERGKPPPLAVRLEEALPFRRVIDDLLSMNREVQKRRSTCESGKANRT